MLTGLLVFSAPLTYVVIGHRFLLTSTVGSDRKEIGKIVFWVGCAGWMGAWLGWWQ
jgi:hypothetical protein